MNLSIVAQDMAVPVGELEPYPSNARRGDMDVIKQSLQVNGQYRTVVVNRRTKQVLAGNHTFRAACELGWGTIAVDWVDVSEVDAKRIVTVDNRANDLAGYDNEMLAELLSSLDGDLLGTGYTAPDLEELLASLQPGGYSADQKNRVPPLPADPVTELGDVIELGPHRLICGDALEVWPALGVADLVVTDPPYTVAYEEHLSEGQAARRRQDGLKVGGDGMSGVEADEFINAAMVAVGCVLKPGGAFYVFSPPGADELRFRLALRAATDLMHKQVLLWVKDRFTFGRQDYHWRHESIMYGWRGGAAHFWNGGRNQDSLWDFARPSVSKEHPTMKPVELLERMVENSSRDGEHVVDLFAGSGSTMVACMSTGRRCSMVELDPAYCDVIVARFERLTGTTIR